MYGFLFLVFVILIITCSQTTILHFFILLTYFRYYHFFEMAPATNEEFIRSILLEIIDRFDDGEDSMDIDSDSDSWIPDSDSSSHQRHFDREWLIDIQERLDQLRDQEWLMNIRERLDQLRDHNFDSD